MRQYEDFLEKVKATNPDEFAELVDILSRHTQLVAKNQELMQKQDEYISEYERLSKELVEYKNAMEMQQTLINNNMSLQQ